MTRIVLASLVSLLLIQDPDPATDYKNRQANIGKMIAGKHVGIGDYLASQSMHGWARDQFNAAIAADPDNEAAHKRLGDKRKDDGAGWEFDTDAKVEMNNKGGKKEDELIKIKGEYEKKLAEAGKAISGEYLAMGNAAEKASLKDDAQACWKKAIEWNASNESARKKLGHEKTKEGFWVSPADKALYKELLDGLAKAPKGAEDKGTSEAGGKVGATMTRRASENFVIESSYLDQKTLEGLVQIAEHSTAMFHKFFNQTKLFNEKYTITILKDKAQHEKYVDAFHTGSDVQKEFAKKSAGMGGYPKSECYTGDRPNTSNEDYCIHYPVQSLVGNVAGHNCLWLLEGSALWFSAKIKSSAFWACVDLAGTGTGGGGKNYQDPKNWPFVIKTWLKEGKDPAIEGIIKCSKWSELDGAETVKSWSLVDFLMTEYKEKLIQLMQDLKSEKDSGEESFKKIFNWSLQDLDSKWKAWARAAYESVK